MNYELRIKKGVKTPDRKLEFRDKRVLVMGLGLHGGGAGTVKFLAQKGSKLTVTDLRNQKILRPALKNLKELKNIRYILGRHRKEDFLRSDLIVKNPGVKPNSPFLKIAEKGKIPITSDLGIFFKNCPGRIIGITGTRGKSTTAYLIWSFLKEKFKNSADRQTSPNFSKKNLGGRVFLAGNIRKSVLEILPRVKKNDWVVLELSSFQLHDLAEEKKSPQIAVITNIFPDHLNWHKSFSDYVRAKSNIFIFQSARDCLFLARSDGFLRKLAKKAPSKIILAGLPNALKNVVDRNLGKHYRNSAALAVAVAKHLEVERKIIQEVFKKFKGLEGRQELAATKRRIRWINDTTSTVPEATMAALERFARPAPRRLILIAGGQDKNLDFRKMSLAIKKYASFLILLPGTATEKLKKLLPKLDLVEVKSMSEAVKKAAKFAEGRDFVVLSPGAASFGLFANEFDRGEKFVDAINKL